MTADEYRAVLTAVREAIDLPAPATIGDEQAYRAVLDARMRQAVLLLAQVLDRPDHCDVSWSITYLQARLEEHPASYKHWSVRTEDGR